MTTYNIAVIAGDGIGKEVTPEGIRVLEAAGRKFGFSFTWTEFDWNCELYAKTGRTGTMVFVVWETTFSNQDGTVVAEVEESFARR